MVSDGVICALAQPRDACSLVRLAGKDPRRSNNSDPAPFPP